MKLLAQDLTLARGGRTVVAGISFSVGEGEAMLLTGPNGSGKTTLLRALAGFLRPVSGAISLDGGDSEQTIAEQCHYAGHGNAVKDELTVLENVRFWAAFLGGGGSKADALLDPLQLTHLADIPAAYLSAGQRRRLGLARILAAKRPIWLLDEPSVSLDTASVAALGGLVEAHRRSGGLVVAATHVDLGLANTRELRLGVAAEAA
jgi:heme exporter protein A